VKLARHWLLYNQGELTGVEDVEQTRQFLLAGQQLAPNNTRAELEVPITTVEVPETVAQGTAGIGGAEAPQSFSLPTPLQEDQGPQGAPLDPLVAHRMGQGGLSGVHQMTQGTMTRTTIQMKTHQTQKGLARGDVLVAKAKANQGQLDQM